MSQIAGSHPEGNVLLPLEIDLTPTQTLAYGYALTLWQTIMTGHVVVLTDENPVVAELEPSVGQTAARAISNSAFRDAKELKNL